MRLRASATRAADRASVVLAGLPAGDVGEAGAAAGHGRDGGPVVRDAQRRPPDPGTPGPSSPAADRRPSGRIGRERAGRGQDRDRDRQVQPAAPAEQAD
jgi:hypothetical protein